MQAIISLFGEKILAWEEDSLEVLDCLINRFYFYLSFFFLCFLLTGVKGHSYDAGGESELELYLLPENHPLKPLLDTLFSNARVCLDIKSMKKAGFIDPYPRKFTRLVVTHHPLLEGYIIKLYLDAQRYHKNQSELQHWLNRIRGAHLIREHIKQNKLEHLFKVPQKWVYRLPEFPSPPAEVIQKNYILVVEDMQLTRRQENKEIWSSKIVTPELLHNLYDLLNALGLHDCGSIDNIPFSQDGRITFIDTESFDQWPVNLKKLTPYLSPEMKKYWVQIILSKE
jgi:hypothetical protein